MIHLRNASDLGGLYFAVSLVGNQVVLLVSCWIYFEYYAGPFARFDRELVFSCVGGLSAVWFASFGTFLLLINRSYLKTFVSTETGSEFAIRNFRDAEGDDAARSTIFRLNVIVWSSIRGEVDLWVKCNYSKWVQEQPSWFTAGLVATIPDDMLPLRSLLSRAEVTRNAAAPHHKALQLIAGSLKSTAWRRRAKRMTSTLKTLITMLKSTRVPGGRLRLEALRRASLRPIQRQHDDARDLHFDAIDAAIED